LLQFKGPIKRIVPRFEDYMTVGKLLDRLQSAPEDTPVYYQRIEDWYLQPGNGWPEHMVHVYDPWLSADGEYHQAWGAWYDKEHEGFFITAFY